MAFWVLDDNNNKVEAFDKEGILALLEEAIETGSLESIAADSAFVDKLKCAVGGDTHKIAFVTQSKYNELLTNNQLITNAYYFITDDTSYDDIDVALDTINDEISTIEGTLLTYGNRISNVERDVSFLNATYDYRHDVCLRQTGDGAFKIYTTILNRSSTPLTITTFRSELIGTILATGFANGDRPVIGISKEGNNVYAESYDLKVDITSSLGTLTLTDNVIKIY